MEVVIALAMKFWQWSILIALVIIGFVINLFDKKIDNNRVNFKYSDLRWADFREVNVSDLKNKISLNCNWSIMLLRP